MSEWISLERGRAPDRGANILGYFRSGEFAVCEVSSFDGRLTAQGTFLPSNQLTHWMPLPEPPEDSVRKALRLARLLIAQLDYGREYEAAVKQAMEAIVQAQETLK